MKTKFKYVTLMAVSLVMGFSSCGNDGGDVPNDGNKIVPNGEKTQARITLTQSAPASYAYPPGTEIPTNAEKEVKTATLYIFNATQILEKIVPLTIIGTVAESKVFELTTGTHYFYAAVNSPVGLPLIQLGDALPIVEKKVIDVLAIADITGNANGFFMTNVTKPAGVNIVQATQPEATGGLKNDIKLQIGRAVAKVNVNFDPQAQHGGALTAVQYKVKNNPKKMFLMPVLNAGVLETPFFNEGVVTPGNYFENANFLNADLTAPSYAMENSNAAPTNGNSTLISVKGTYTPTKIYNKNGGDEAAGVVGYDFWRILKADDTYMDKMYSEDPNGGTELIAAGIGAQTVKHTAGEAFYGLWLADNAIANDKVAKHTVKRNSYYYMTITSVNGPGFNTEAGVISNPALPIDAETNIKASIEILNWTMIDQSGGI